MPRERLNSSGHSLLRQQLLRPDLRLCADFFCPPKNGMQGHHITSLTKQVYAPTLLIAAAGIIILLYYFPHATSTPGVCMTAPNTHIRPFQLTMVEPVAATLLLILRRGGIWRDPLLKFFFSWGRFFFFFRLSRLGASHAPRISRFGTLEAKKRSREQTHARMAIRGDRISD